jgi:hypothetical protein
VSVDRKQLFPEPVGSSTQITEIPGVELEEMTHVHAVRVRNISSAVVNRNSSATFIFPLFPMYKLGVV